MTLQLLVAAMNKEAMELAQEMQIESDAIIVSQCDHYSYEEILYKEHKIRCFAMAEKGVGLSRNTSLMRADADIILFADEDIVYQEGYAEAVLQEFASHPKADMLLFNVKAVPGRETYHTESFGRVRWYNCGRYPAYSIAVRKEALEDVCGYLNNWADMVIIRHHDINVIEKMSQNLSVHKKETSCVKFRRNTT